MRADAHHDSIYCDRKLERSHLKLAKERGALICDFGDTFCAMQGRYDPRSSLDDLRPEDKGANYLDLIARHAASDYGEFAENFLMIGKGNHESSILKRNGTCLISTLVHRLNSDHGGNVFTGGYGGWIRFLFNVNKTMRSSVNLKYHHGAGGGGPVTRGVIQTNRQAVYQPDANIIVNGHTHDEWIIPIARERLSDSSKVGRDTQWHVRIAGYKDEYAHGEGGFHIETWKPPKPIGAVWLRFWLINREIKMEFTQAVT